MGRIKGTKNKNHIEYVCDNCLKKFNQKNDFTRHKNRLNPCEKKTKVNTDCNENNCNQTNNDETNNNETSNEEYIEDDNIDDNEDLVKNLIKKINYVIKQNEEFKNDIKELKEDNEKLRNKLISNTNSNNTNSNNTNTTNTTNTNSNNTINMNVHINNFNDTDYSQINKIKLLNTLIKEQGKFIYLKAIENLYLNPEKPENHNIYIADKNRGYVKKYNNGRWETDNLSIIDLIINNFIDYYKLSIDDIKLNPEKYEKIKNAINNKIKYIELCDLEYLSNLEDEQLYEDANNKDKIARCKEFREMVYDEIKNLLHDKKDIVLKTHKTKIKTK